MFVLAEPRFSSTGLDRTFLKYPPGRYIYYRFSKNVLSPIFGGHSNVIIAWPSFHLLVNVGSDLMNPRHASVHDILSVANVEHSYGEVEGERHLQESFHLYRIVY